MPSISPERRNSIIDLPEAELETEDHAEVLELEMSKKEKKKKAKVLSQSDSSAEFSVYSLTASVHIIVKFSNFRR